MITAWYRLSSGRTTCGERRVSPHYKLMSPNKGVSSGFAELRSSSTRKVVIIAVVVVVVVVVVAVVVVVVVVLLPLLP